MIGFVVAFILGKLNEGKTIRKIEIQNKTYKIKQLICNSEI